MVTGHIGRVTVARLPLSAHTDAAFALRCCRRGAPTGGVALKTACAASRVPHFIENDLIAPKILHTVHPSSWNLMEMLGRVKYKIRDY